jgi:hypothetical protein
MQLFTIYVQTRPGLATHQSQTLPQYPSARHVLLGFEFAEIQRTRENQHVSHIDQSLQERHGDFDRHALSGLDHVQFALQENFR